MKDLQTALVNLLKVKSVVTIILTAVFAYLSIIGTVDGQQFLLNDPPKMVHRSTEFEFCE